MVQETLDFISTDFKEVPAETFQFDVYGTERRATFENTTQTSDFELRVHGFICQDDLRLEVEQILVYLDQAIAEFKYLGDELYYDKYNSLGTSCKTTKG